MRAKPAVAGAILLGLGTLLAAQALGPYLVWAPGSWASLVIPVFLLLIAMLTAGAGVLLLNSARLSAGQERDALAESVEDPHGPPRIRSLVRPVPPIGQGRRGLSPGGGVIGSEYEQAERDRD